MPWNACTTARSPATSRSRTATSSPSRPVNPGLRAGRFHTRGTLPGSRGPAPPSFRSPPGVPRPGNTGSPSGRRGPFTAASSTRRASAASRPNRSQKISGRSTAGISSGGTSSTRTGTRRPCPARHVHQRRRPLLAWYTGTARNTRPRTAPAPGHSGPAHRSSPARSSGRPAQSHTSSSTVYPASVSCQATHSAHARSAPA